MNPEAVHKNVSGYVENARGLPPDVAYGWDLRVAGDVARWRECVSETQCSETQRERPASELLGTHAVGHASAGDSGEVEVFKLTLKTHRRNVMPRSP